MTIKGLIWTILFWVILTLINYYYMPFFVLAFIWLGLSLILLIISIAQIVKLIKERKDIKKLRILKLIIFTILFLLTFFMSTTNLAIEKIDWLIFYNKRTEIVRHVIEKELNPNVSWNGQVCELPFEFPVVSNGGNDILIHRNKATGKTTITFYVFRNFFEHPSTHFVFTDDPNKIKKIEDEILNNPEENWKIKDYWYRTYHD